MVMLSGDNARAAQAIASEVGLTRAVADLMPEDKVNAVEQMVVQFGTVAMVGDGVNDAPALASATVGIAMGGASTDLALETADVVLMADDLARLPLAVELGRATRAVITQNLALSLAVIAGLVVASLVGATGIGGAIVLHEGSTLAVALNAMRLLAHRGR
jgi:Cd2+/Zn2+-exporting ATPase